nr:hypothetical protein CFP56_55021 [Quercus suber]
MTFRPTGTLQPHLDLFRLSIRPPGTPRVTSALPRTPSRSNFGTTPVSLSAILAQDQLPVLFRSGLGLAFSGSGNLTGIDRSPSTRPLLLMITFAPGL